MTPTPEVQERLRRYLLGQLTDDAREEVEKELLANDELFEELLVVEDEIIDDYLSGKLGEPERAAFEQNFLATPERHDKLRFGRAFNRYLSSQAAAVTTRQVPASRGAWAWAQTLVSSPFRIAAFAIIVVGIAFGVWRIFFHQSEVDKGLLALNAAYREQRPVEARISKLDYAPYLTTRGPGSEKVDQNELRRAELTLLDAQAKNPTPTVHHALGKVYLAKKQFDDAISQFDEALKSDPKNAQLYSDLGAAWLEKGKVDRDGKEPGKGMEELGRSLENLKKALELNPNLLEAHFNRALCEEQMTLYSQAEDDWREYLRRDQNSPWADEARRSLQRLENQKNKKAQTKEQLLKDFLAAYESKNASAAWASLSPSRGRTGNLIVEALLDEYLSLVSSNRIREAKDELRKLSYAGKIEAAKVGDLFTLDLARIYGSAATVQRERLAQARQLMKSAIDRYNKAEYSEAIELFSKAAQLFSQSANVCERLFAEAWVGYCYLRIPDPEKGIQIFQRLSQVFEARNYKSLLAQSLLARADALNGKNEFSKLLERANESLAVSEQIEDRANAVRSLQASTSIQLVMSNYRESLDATSRALSLAEGLPPDPKITWPFYHEASLDFYFLGMPTSALQFENEALRLAMGAGLALHTSRSYDRLALILEQLHNYGDAMKNSELARTEGQKITDERVRTNILAHSALNLGRLHRETGDLRKAIDSMDQALVLYKQLGLDIYQYQAHKGKMLAFVAMNDNVGAQRELDEVLYWFEQNRQKIAEESYRDRFFDTGQDTYDLAIDFAYSRTKDASKAFDYAEASRARSLLDLITAGTLTLGDGNNPELRLLSVIPPLKLQQIQGTLPEHTQLLEYSMLDDKTIIWVITRSELKSAETKIARDVLTQKIRNYLELLSHGSSNQGEVTSYGKELYAALIRPVEGYLNRHLQLCIIPDDQLNFLPFASLVSPESSRYLIEDYALETAPSATVFIATSENAIRKVGNGAEHLLIVGNPNFDREQFADLPELPAANREAEQIASFYGATPLIGKAAIVSRVVKTLNEVEVAHFATHAVTNRSPMLTKLLLAKDGKEMHHASASYLRAVDIYQMKLNHTRLVVLSACETGIERAYRGEGAIGLARPFLAAGVPLVIASLWPVESEAAADLMISFHKHRTQDHVSTVEALRRAQVEALHNPQSDSQKNYDWAAFVAIGGYASF